MFEKWQDWLLQTQVFLACVKDYYQGIWTIFKSVEILKLIDLYFIIFHASNCCLDWYHSFFLKQKKITNFGENFSNFFDSDRWFWKHNMEKIVIIILRNDIWSSFSQSLIHEGKTHYSEVCWCSGLWRWSWQPCRWQMIQSQLTFSSSFVSLSLTG